VRALRSIGGRFIASDRAGSRLRFTTRRVVEKLRDNERYIGG
jgi:hypothetical protein